MFSEKKKAKKTSKYTKQSIFGACPHWIREYLFFTQKKKLYTYL